MAETEPLVPAGTRVKYWGNAVGNKYYGTEMTVLWANECGCAHQTYALQTHGGAQLSKVLRASFSIVGEEQG
jgi:hypothetical protein